MWTRDGLFTCSWCPVPPWAAQHCPASYGIVAEAMDRGGVAWTHSTAGEGAVAHTPQSQSVGGCHALCPPRLG